jgi:hypothetical protein
MGLTARDSGTTSRSTWWKRERAPSPSEIELRVSKGDAFAVYSLDGNAFEPEGRGFPHGAGDL